MAKFFLPRRCTYFRVVLILDTEIIKGVEAKIFQFLFLDATAKISRGNKKQHRHRERLKEMEAFMFVYLSVCLPVCLCVCEHERPFWAFLLK